jgi:hypothetical protein
MAAKQEAKKSKQEERRKYLYREELTAEQHRDRVMDFLNNCPIGCHLVLKALGEPIRAPWADRYLWARDPQWCDHDFDEHVAPDLQYMVIKSDHALCEKCGAKYFNSELLNRLPTGKGARKTATKIDETLAKINYHPQPERLYYFRDGETIGLSTDPAEALAQCHPHIKSTFEGVLLEVAGIGRARQIIKDGTIELPFAELRLRADMTLAADWHGAPLTAVEQRTLREQAEQGLKEKRADRQRMIDQMRQEMNSLTHKPL